jgi:hypothetical protein
MSSLESEVSRLADRPVIYRGLAAAARRIPGFRDDKSPHPATLSRWITRGVRLQDGTVLRLTAKRFPGGWAVCDADVDTFVDRLTADRTGEPVEVPAVMPAARRRAIEQTDRELDAIRI